MILSKLYKNIVESRQYCVNNESESSILVKLKSMQPNKPTHPHTHTQNWGSRRLFKHIWCPLDLECASNWHWFAKPWFWSSISPFLWTTFILYHKTVNDESATSQKHPTIHISKFWRVCSASNFFSKSYSIAGTGCTPCTSPQPPLLVFLSERKTMIHQKTHA